MQRLIVIGIILALVGYGFRQYRAAPETRERDRTGDASYFAVESSPSAAASSFRCDGRTRCTQMTSCEEATYFLRNCPGVKMDGDGDGEPCEDQWCR